MNYPTAMASQEAPLRSPPPGGGTHHEPEVVRELRQMQRQIELLADTISTMSDRLIPVTSMSEPKSAKGHPVAEVSLGTESPMGSEIRSMTGQVDVQISRLLSMIHMLRI